MSPAEAVALTATLLLGALTIVGYLIGATGASLSPTLIMAISLVVAVAIAARVPRERWRADAALALAAVVVVGTGAYLLWLAWPAMLPPGGGSDLTHHLLLIDAIERDWRLVFGADAGAFLGEMAHYTPGVHLVAAIAGALLRSDGFHALYPMVALSVALKLTFVLFIALRLLPNDARRFPLALVAVVLIFVPRAYSVGSFAAESFLAQVLSELFAVACWWAIVMWDLHRQRAWLLPVALLLAAIFLTWPIWVGPIAVTLAVVALGQSEVPVTRRVALLALAGAPLMAVATIHLLRNAAWLSIAGTSGAVPPPSLALFGWLLPLLAVIGSAAALRQRSARPLIALLLAIVLQAAALAVLAIAAGASTPYMAIKMLYLAIYPMAIAAAGAFAVVWPPRGHGVLWIVAALALVMTGRDLAAQGRPAPIVSDDLFAAGRWARGHLPPACVDYVVMNEYTAYWLHLAVMRNPRASDRTRDDATFLTQRAVERWLTPGGLRYAIVDLRRLPAEIRDEVGVLARFGDAAVIEGRRRGPCR